MGDAVILKEINGRVDGCKYMLGFVYVVLGPYTRPRPILSLVFSLIRNVLSSPLRSPTLVIAFVQALMVSTFCRWQMCGALISMFVHEFQLV